VLIARREHQQAYERELGRITDGIDHEIVWLDRLTEGAACTVLHARRLINNDDEVLVANSDQLVDVDINAFLADARARRLDGSIMTFECPLRENKWSYARLDASGLVLQVREKTAISTHATVGIYWWARGRDFVSAAIDMIIANDRVNGEFYVCPVFNWQVRDGRRVGVWEIGPDAMHGTGTPEDLAAYVSFLGERPAEAR
jgi:dTDP-glucose pyrophosphorylase